MNRNSEKVASGAIHDGMGTESVRSRKVVKIQPCLGTQCAS